MSGAEELLDRQLYEPIAIVGIGLRFPGGCETPEQFADFLREGRSGIREVPGDRWDVPAFTSADGGAEPGKIRSVRGGFLDRVDEFDAQFFNISPKEAPFMDPQQRMLLETVWSALEHANIDPTPLRRGNGGVFVGASSIDYALELESLPYEQHDGHLAAGITFFPLSGRLSYFLGWRGPCMTIDTACASSLTALHQAVVALRRGESDIAVAAGVNALHHPRIPVIFSNANMLAPDGECKTFDDAADGYVRAEGCGALILKRLSDAQRDGDTVLALVRGSAVGQDGDSAGLTVPNGTAQTAVIRTALAHARLTPADISYVEAHGTGTALGDPIEIGAISDVFAGSHTVDAPVVVGSVKTNLGHMEPVAGIVGVVKTVLQMRERMIFPHLNMVNPSGRIPWDRSPVAVPTTLRPWQAPVRRAVVNSFGFGGTIAAAVLEEAPALPAVPPTAPGPDAVFTVSAKNKRALRTQLERYRDFLASHPDASAADLAYTANTGRAHFPLRAAAAVDDRAEIADFLDRQLAKGEPDGTPDAGVRKVAFLFAGQGAQYPGMGAGLYAGYPAYRAAVDKCDALFVSKLGRSVRDLVLGTDPHGEDIHRTLYTQPALFTLEYALAQLWLSWGIRPSVLIGHSIGEVVAAAVAGLFDLPDAVALVAARARLMESVTVPGGMVAVTAPADEVTPLLAPYPRLALAAVNSPRQCVVSGADDELAAVVAELAARGLSAKRLSVSHAFHSPLMTEVFDAFRTELRDIRFHEPTLTLISNVTGKVARPAELSTVDYWVGHIGAPVQFAAGMAALERRGRHAFVEIGPSTALTSLAKQCVDPAQHRWFTSLTTTDSGTGTLRRALAGIYALGIPVDWRGYHRDARHTRLDLPTYGFDRKRYWLPGKGSRHRGLVAGSGPVTHPLLGSEVSTVDQRDAGVREFAVQLSVDAPGYLTDHRVNGEPVFPGTGYVELALAVQDAVFGRTDRAVEDLRVAEPLLLGGDGPAEVRTRLRPAQRPGDGYAVEIVSVVAGDAGPIERRHATATIAADPGIAGLSGPAHAVLAAAADAAAIEPEARLATDEVYAEFSAVGMDYGPRFRRVGEVERYAGGLAVAHLTAEPGSALDLMPPPVLDGAQHALVGVVDDDGDNYLPVRFGRFRLHRKPRGTELRAVLRLATPDADGVDLAADLVLLDGDEPVAELIGLGLRRLSDGNRRHFLHRQLWTKRSLVVPPAGKRRRVLVLGRTAAELTGLVDEAVLAGTELVFGDLAVLQQVAPHEAVTDVCWFWRGATDPAGVAALRTESAANYRDLLDLLGRLERAGFGRDQRLWLVTERSQWLRGDGPDGGDALAAATVWGFGKVLLNEYPSYRTTLVDFGDRHDHRGLVAEWQAPDSGEYQLAFRDGVRHVRRLLPATAEQVPAGDFALEVTEYGRFAGIKPVPLQSAAAPPAGDGIQVRVHAAGLNFKDVLNALGVLRTGPDDPGQPLGFEGAGTVVAAGPEATFVPGDEVIVNYPGCLRTTVTVPSAAAVRKPVALTFPQAAGLAAGYVTAWYALHHLARIKPGDRVLIHAAAGGVGQAAVRIARLAGATVYATASPHKWGLLHRQGVEHVYHSRTLDFAEQLAGEVDVVLNSLNKEFIPAGIGCLAPLGRFVELGKVGAWTPAQVAEVRPDVAYHNFDLSELPEDTMLALNREILDAVVARVESGGLTPLPVTTYAADEVAEAFGVLSRGANVGKLVVSFVDEEVPAAAAVAIRPDRTYVVAGGLGGFGLVTAAKLVDLGARHIALVSRGTAPHAAVTSLYERLRKRAEVSVHQADIGDPHDMARLVTTLRAAPHPVGGIVHAAGGLADAPVASQSWASVEALFQAKVYGSWLLHEAAGHFPDLDLFVAHSSAAAVVGGASQANYAAANSFLDAVVALRTRQGLPALGFNWGPLAEVGMSARLSTQHIKALEHEGIRFFTPGKAMRTFARLLERPVGQYVGGECDWNRFVAGKSIRNALYAELIRKDAAGGYQLDRDALLTQPAAERRAALTTFVRAVVAEVLHIEDLEDVPAHAEFVSLGLDSLVAVELKNALESSCRTPLPTSLAFDYPSALAVAEFLDRQLVPDATHPEENG